MAAVQKGQVCATQFHPEKSGEVGLDILDCFLRPGAAEERGYQQPSGNGVLHGLAKRVIACLDVRANDSGDLVVTKGDQYDVRESAGACVGGGAGGRAAGGMGVGGEGGGGGQRASGAGVGAAAWNLSTLA